MIENNLCCGFFIFDLCYVKVDPFWDSLVAQIVKKLPTMREIPSKPIIWRVFCFLFNHKWVFNIVKSFPASIEIMFFIFQFVYVMYHIDWFVYIEEYLHPSWSWCVIKDGVWSFYFVVALCFLEFCGGFLHLCSLVILACNFPFVCVASLSGFGSRVVVAS